MAVTSRHPECLAQMDDWRTLRDAMAGSRAIRLAQERYIPRPGGMTPFQYDAYLRRGEWYNATARTVRGLAGEVFRKPMTMQGLESEAMLAWQRDVTGQGLPLRAFAGTIIEQVLLMGHYGVLVDVRTDADGRAIPVWAGYPIEHVRSWGFRRTTRGLELVHVILLETDWMPMAGDAEAREAVTRYRVLALSDDGVYSVRVYEQMPRGELIEVANTALPQRRGAPLSFIPFVLFGATGLAWCLQASLLLPLVQINLRHWRHACDYEHGLHLTALPTLVITGHNVEHDVSGDGRAVPRIILGSQGGIVLPEAEAKVYLLEYQGQGLAALEAAIETDKRDMAVMGARLLEETPKVEERELAVKQRHNAETSALRQVAEAVSLGLTRLGQWSAWWAGEVEDPAGDEVRVTLNRDYVMARLSAQDLVALMQATQQGLLSRESWFYNLAQGEITEPGLSFEQEEARIAAQPPVTIALGG